jgi:tryptophan-rich sensory protein
MFLVKNNFFRIVISLLIPLLIGFLGSFFTSSSLDLWYVSLNKPSFNPPNWIFAPVWTSLYLLIGLSFYFVWKKGINGRVTLIYFLQLFLNLLWSVLFFGFGDLLLAFIEIIILLIVIIVNLICFYRISRVAGYLFIPYLFWVGFALILNFTFLIIN